MTPSSGTNPAPGFKRTEIGHVPADWAIKPLGAVLSKARLGGNYPNQDAEAEWPLMKMGNIGRGRFDISKTEYVVPGVDPDRAHRLAAGDVLFNTRNTLDLVGKVAMWRNELPVAYFNSNLMRLEFDPAQIASNEYGNLFLNTAGSVSRLRAMATGTTSVAAIYTRDLLTLPIAAPPLLEQQAIAEAMNDVDAMLDGLGRLIAKKRDLKQAAMQQLLTGQSRLPGFKDEWKVTRLEELFRFSGGYSASRDELSNGGHCYLHYGDIHGSSKTSIDTIVDSQDIPRLDISLRRVSPDSLLDDGDVVFVDASEDDAGTTKHVVVSNAERLPFIAGLHTIVAKAKAKDLNHQYRHYCFQTEAVRRQFLFYAVGTKVLGISKTNIAKVALPVPPVTEQIEIAAMLSDMDKDLSAVETRRDKTRALKQAMMQELLTGRIRLI